MATNNNPGGLSLGDRMKQYEGVSHPSLMRRTPVIIRLDGKAFHTFTRGLDKPFDSSLNIAMVKTMQSLASEIQGSVFAYTQSDEISILLQDWRTLTTDCWYGYDVQKMSSVSASIATAVFNRVFQHPTKPEDSFALFDARVFNLPKEEVTNYFIWRQQDAVRNSINALAQSQFPHKELQGLNTSQVQDKLMLEKTINWNDTETRFKRGVAITSTTFDDKKIIEIDTEIPIFTQDRAYVDQYVN